MMKKYLFLSVLLSVICISAYSQEKVKEEQIVGDWEITGGEGKKFEEDIVGSVFHFMPSNIVIGEKKSKNGETKTRKGTWKIINNTIVLHKENEDPDSKGTIIVIRKIEKDDLILFDMEEEMTIVFKRISN